MTFYAVYSKRPYYCNITHLFDATNGATFITCMYGDCNKDTPAEYLCQPTIITEKETCQL